MKRFFTLLFSLIIIQQSNAQNWIPFAFDQLSYYKQEQADGSTKVETFLMDKYGPYNGFGTSYIFNGFGDLPEACSADVLNYIKAPWLVNKDKLEYLQIIGASNFLYRNPANTSQFVEFRPKAAVGASWTTNGLTFTCSAKVYKNVLGTLDSVRIFKCQTAPFDTIEIELSKSLGFTKFLPFNEFFDPAAQDGRSPYFELIGYKLGNIKVGYHQPEFSDYFPLNVGDELYWEHYTRKVNNVTIDYYYDKVTKAYHSPDSVYYEFNRTVIKDGVVKENLQVSNYYLKSIFGEMVEGKTSWYGTTPVEYKSQFFPPKSSRVFWVMPIFFNVEKGDTITRINFTKIDMVIGPTNCQPAVLDEQYYDHKWSTQQGVTYYSDESLYAQDRINLLGSKINGKVTGTLEVPNVQEISKGWGLFNKDQKGMYLQSYKNSLQVETFLVDSVRNANNDEYSYFNSKSDQFGNCYSEFKGFINKSMPYTINVDKIDSLIFTGDTILFISDQHDSNNKIDTFLFKPFSKVGSAWETNGITIKCVDQVFKNVFGVMDSVKTFKCMTAPFDTIEFKLSQNYGLLKFWPLNEFIRKSNDTPRKPYFELIGYTKGTLKKGYQQPDFSDYFHLKKDDILYWEIKYQGSPYPVLVTKYYIDSITTAFISKDSVHYDFKRTIINEGHIESTQSSFIYYLRKKEGMIVEGPTSWYGLLNDQVTHTTYYLNPLQLNIENNDTITIASYSMNGASLNMENCSSYVIIDFDKTQKYSTKEGEIFTGSYSWGPDTQTLIGSIINGKETGITDIETSVSKPIEEITAIYPNPVHDVLNLKLSKPGKSIEIYDMNNKLLIKSLYTEQVDLGSLNPGVYILRVNYFDVSKFVRVVKQ